MDSKHLSQLMAKVLKEELREDEHSREQGLEQFRDWILKNPDIRDCPTDDSFLLPFLRVRKYSVPMAEQTLMKLLKLHHNFPEISSNLDINDPDINDVITRGEQFCSTNTTKTGNRIYMLIAKNYGLNQSYERAVRAYILLCHALARDELSQIFGVVYICDYEKMSPGLFTSIPIAVMKAITESVEKAFPVRVKQVHILNLPSVAMWFIKNLMSLVSEKSQNRVMFHSSLEELHQHVDKSVLPKEYGGTMPMDEMIGLWKKELAVHREAILAINNIKLVGDSFKNDLESNDTGISNVPGSFRKLQVD